MSRPVVIEARGVEKTFRIPQHKVDTFKERALHPFSRSEYRELRALRGISFDVHEGEFFGIVGLNGAGRLAPFIELGVGFNPELTSRENVVLNGVMMGLGRREAQRRLDAVLDFAELRGFADLKLKNYSSGMMVRLAFAVMVEADADTMLIDEVLAVGDASFAQKCMDVFRAKRAAGKTLVLVTHDMATVQSFCDRAMLLHDGELRYLGDAEEAALRYYRLNFGGADGGHAGPGGVPDVNVRVVDAWLADEAGQRVENVEQDEAIGLSVVFEARHDLEAPVFGFHFLDADGQTLFGFNRTLERAAGESDLLPAGRRVRISGRIENRLLPGRYFVNCWISRNRNQGDLALHVVRLLDFVVYGTRPGPGSFSVNVDVEAGVERDPDRAQT
jgi:ABC-type polysaccharide/polyol phosphate transport system ATPase subunit